MVHWGGRGSAPERGTFFTLQVWERVRISRAKVYKRASLFFRYLKGPFFKIFRILIPLNCTVLIYWTQRENGQKTSCLSSLFSQLEKLKIELVGVTLQSIRMLGGLQSTRHAFFFIIHFILSTSSVSTTWMPFKYLGSFVADSKEDFLTREAQAGSLQQTAHYMTVKYFKENQACLL